MQKVFEKILRRIYDEQNGMIKSNEVFTMGEYEGLTDAKKIIEQAASEYDNAIIDGKYCFQTCACTEKCDKCSRLCNGDTDWYENIDDWKENCNGDWIPCSERLPEKYNRVLAYTDAGGYYIAHVNGCGKFVCTAECVSTVIENSDVIAWQPLPAPYQPKGE